MFGIRKRIENWIRTIVSDELKEYISSTTVDLYLVEMGTVVCRKKDYPFVPKEGEKIEVEEDGMLFHIREVRMSSGGFTAHLYGRRVPN